MLDAVGAQHDEPRRGHQRAEPQRQCARELLPVPDAGRKQRQKQNDSQHQRPEQVFARQCRVYKM